SDGDSRGGRARRDGQPDRAPACGCGPRARRLEPRSRQGGAARRGRRCRGGEPGRPGWARGGRDHDGRRPAGARRRDGRAGRRRSAIDGGEYPTRFALYRARKDADLILEAAARAGTELRLTTAARNWLADAEEAGLGEADYSAVLARILGNTEATQEESSER